MKNKITTKQIATGGILLALLIVSQLFKNLSVYITGPIVNAILIIATLTLGPVVGIILSIIAPITSFIITASPVMKAVPLIIPAVMVGNSILCICVHLLFKTVKKPFGLPAGLVAGVLCKALFMTVVISNCLLVYMPGSLPEKAIGIAKKTFSVTQLITGAIGAVIAFIVWIPVSKTIRKN